MTVVAIAALGSPFFDGVARGQIGLGALPGMALVAGIGLRTFIEYGVCLAMYGVAAVAGQIFVIVYATLPQHLSAAVVAATAAFDL